MEVWNRNSFNLKEFKNKSIMVCTPTNKERIDFLSLLLELKIKWLDTNNVKSSDNEWLKEQNVIFFCYPKDGLGFVNDDTYEDVADDYKIIEWEIADKKTRGFEIVSDEFRKTNEEITLPTRGSKISAGYDFYSPIDIVIQPHSKVCVWSDIKAYMQEGEVLLLYVRSSIGIKRGLRLSNGTGVIDADYYSNSDNDGNIGISLHNYTDEPVTISKEERICQGIFIPFLVADNGNTDKERVGGIGSTGTK